MPITKKPYTADFRQQAVNLLLSSGRPLKQVAQELGISSMSLRNWRDAFLAKSAPIANGSASSTVDPISLAAELRKVQRENEYLRRQREILKKAMSILSVDPHSDML
jgi:transposase